MEADLFARIALRGRPFRHRAHREDQAAPRVVLPDRAGRGGGVELQAVRGVRPPVFLPEGRGCADPRRPVPRERAEHLRGDPRRADRDRHRLPRGVREEGGVPDLRPLRRGAWRREPSPGARAEEAPPRGGGAVRRGAQAPASPVSASARDRDVIARRRPARHGPGGALPLPGGGDRSRPVAGPGGRRGGGDRGGARRAVRLRRRGCRPRRPGGRLDRGPVGVQRGGGRAGHRPFPRSGHQRGRARDRLHAGRSCRGPPRSHPDRRGADGRPRPCRAPRSGRGPLPAGATGRCPLTGNGPSGVADRRGETVGPAPPPSGKAVRRRRPVVLALGTCALRGPGRPGNRRAPLRLGADPLPRGVGFRKARGARGPSRPRTLRRGRAKPPPAIRLRSSRRQAGLPQSDRRAHSGLRDRARPRHAEGDPFRLGNQGRAGSRPPGFRRRVRSDCGKGRKHDSLRAAFRWMGVLLRVDPRYALRSPRRVRRTVSRSPFRPVPRRWAIPWSWRLRRTGRSTTWYYGGRARSGRCGRPHRDDTRD